MRERIINSLAALYRRAVPGMSVYALLSLPLLALPVVGHGFRIENITVNCIEPGPIDTDANPATGPQAEFRSG